MKISQTIPRCDSNIIRQKRLGVLGGSFRSKSPTLVRVGVQNQDLTTLVTSLGGEKIRYRSSNIYDVVAAQF